MNQSNKLYVPNAQLWVKFFDKVSQGKVKFDQRGGGNISQIVSLDNHILNESDAKQLPVKVVAPAEQTVEQAKSALKRENINPSVVADMFHTHARRRRLKTSKRRAEQRDARLGKL